MPRYGDSTFHGKKGRSGRYTKFNEETKHKVIQDAWVMTGQNLVPERALPIVLKDMTGTQDLNVNLGVPILDALFNHQRNQENNRNVQEDSDSPGRHGRIQDSQHNALLDSPGAIGQSTDFDECRERELPPLEKGRDTGLPPDNEGA